MKKTILFIVLATLCLNFKARAQNDNLKIGDKMPDVVIANIINSRLKSANISDFKGKLIILDFWSTWCSSCIDGFPEMDSLQRKFSGKIQILLVNPKKEGDSQRGVKIVIDRINKWSARKLIIPIVFQDTSLSQHFKFQSIPHCVWIDQQDNIVGITGKEDVTQENITKIIKGEKLFLPEKKN